MGVENLGVPMEVAEQLRWKCLGEFKGDSVREAQSGRSLPIFVLGFRGVEDIGGVWCRVSPETHGKKKNRFLLP